MFHPRNVCILATCYTLNTGCKGLWRPVQEHTIWCVSKNTCRRISTYLLHNKSITKRLVYNIHYCVHSIRQIKMLGVLANVLKATIQLQSPLVSHVFLPHPTLSSKINLNWIRNTTLCIAWILPMNVEKFFSLHSCCFISAYNLCLCF